MPYQVRYVARPIFQDNGILGVLFLVKFYIFKSFCDLENKVKVTKIQSALKLIPIKTHAISVEFHPLVQEIVRVKEFVMPTLTRRDPH